MRWKIEVVGVAAADRLAVETLSALGMVLLDEPTGTYIAGELFERCDSAGAARDEAARIRDVMRSLRRVVRHYDLEFDLGNHVLETTHGGKTRGHHYLEVHDTLHVTVATEAVLLTTYSPLTDDERQALAVREAEARFRSSLLHHVRLTQAALSDKRMLLVMELLHGEPSIDDLGRAAEMIESDLGSRVNEPMSRKRLQRFYRSLNHPDVFGPKVARHSVSTETPPPQPMTREEATCFARDLADAWIREKLLLGA